MQAIIFTIIASALVFANVDGFRWSNDSSTSNADQSTLLQSSESSDSAVQAITMLNELLAKQISKNKHINESELKDSDNSELMATEDDEMTVDEDDETMSTDDDDDEDDETQMDNESDESNVQVFEAIVENSSSQ